MEFVAGCEGHDQARQKEKTFNSRNFLPDSRHRFCRSHGAQYYSVAESRRHCFVRSLYLHGLARDIARGLDPAWVRELYSFAVKPTGAFYFRVPLEVSITRLHAARSGFKFYEAGLDLGMTEDTDES